MPTALQILERSLKAYKPKQAPTMKGGEQVYLDGELNQIATIIAALRTVVLDHEERIIALEGG